MIKSEELHTKRKGIIGELAVAHYLASRDLPVFKELGDLSKIDLITEVNNKLIKIQVKTVTSKKGKVEILTYKAGPNYRFHYEKDDVDVFAVYVLDKDILLFVGNEELFKCKSSMTIRLEKTKNNQRRFVRHYTDYLDFMSIFTDVS